jgi:hypothetical protein
MTDNVLHLPPEVTQLWEPKIIWTMRPEMALSPEDHAMLGPLAEVRAYTDNYVDILDAIYNCARTKMQTGPNQLDTLCAIARALEILIDAGYTQYEPLLSELQIGFRRLAQTSRRLLTRKMLSSKVSDEEAEEIRQFLLDTAWADERSPSIVPLRAG